MKDRAMTIHTFATWDSPAWEKSIRARERNNTNLRKAKRFEAKKAKKGKQRENDGNRIAYLVRAGRRNDDRSGRDGKHFLAIISDGWMIFVDKSEAKGRRKSSFSCAAQNEERFRRSESERLSGFFFDGRTF